MVDDTMGRCDDGDAYGLGPRIVSLRVFDRYHDVPPFGNGHDPRGRIGVKIAQVGTR
jgi:hypothetical protein